ncbi:MAG: hypothetical protein PW788_07505 [Micavibrio sp.]|nr:hypothetical protein [Micavibrio sp.]
MWPFNNKAKEDFAKAQHREQMLKTAQLSASVGNMRNVYATITALQMDGPINDIVAEDVICGMVNTAAHNNLKEGLGLAIWLVNQHRPGEEALRERVTERAFALLDRLKGDDEKLTATGAMMCLVIAARAPAGSAHETKALRLWDETVDALAKTQSGIQFAFAAACNAALGFNDMKTLLRGQAIDKWEKLVLQLAQRDKFAALKETQRVVVNYSDFGKDGRVFRNRAFELMVKVARSP